MSDIDQVRVDLFLINVVNLFNDTLQVILHNPILCLFLAVLVFLIAAGLLSWIIYLGRKGRL